MYQSCPKALAHTRNRDTIISDMANLTILVVYYVLREPKSRIFQTTSTLTYPNMRNRNLNELFYNIYKKMAEAQLNAQQPIHLLK